LVYSGSMGIWLTLNPDCSHRDGRPGLTGKNHFPTSNHEHSHRIQWLWVAPAGSDGARTQDTVVTIAGAGGSLERCLAWPMLDGLGRGKLMT
jgi:hypothetical protein